ncbi:MAG: hypothetical protein A2X31_03610 [Elusimicrobia bacterium GWB2_63_22]|nr:MAG: hypothetical protein A2X31_03610 [Elusimicrobia bacterium GWB2_63_22]
MAKKILIVDDEPDMSETLRRIFEPRGFQVKVCDNGLEVVDALVEFKPDLLIMDVMLPGVDGYTLVSSITGSVDRELNTLPIIIISALDTSRCMFESFRQVKAFFSKPFEPQDFLEAVNTAIDTREFNAS